MGGFGSPFLFMKNSIKIKYFIEAPSKEALVHEMIKVGGKFGAEFTFDTPIKEGKKWVVWFTVQVERALSLMEDKNVD